MFGGFFQTFAKIAEWLFSGIVKFAIFDFLMKNPEKSNDWQKVYMR